MIGEPAYEYLKLIDEESTRVMPNEMEKLVRELPRDSHVFQKKQRRMYDCKTLQFSNTQQIMPDPEAAVAGWGSSWLLIRPDRGGDVRSVVSPEEERSPRCRTRGR
jgi:hypothetical protein